MDQFIKPRKLEWLVVLIPILIGITLSFTAYDTPPTEIILTYEDNKRRSEKAIDYIEKYAHIAMEEQQKYGVLASIKLAQGVYESNNGQSRLAREQNNHFGIKCFGRNCAADHCGNAQKTRRNRYRSYKSAEECYREHSKLLTKKRYRHLLGEKDYKKVAYGLKKAGYATNEVYAQKLVKIVKLYELDQFDNQKIYDYSEPVESTKAEP